MLKANRIPVLCYHNIECKEKYENLETYKEWTIEEEFFEKQIKLIKKLKYKTLTLEEFYKWKEGKINLPLRSVLITFDDGHYNNYKYAFPILKKYNVNATVFVIGDKIDKEKFLSKEIIEKCKTEYSNIEFACHTYSLHEKGKLEKLTQEEIREDLKKYNTVLKSDFFAYPYGDYDEKLINELKRQNYKMAFIFGKPKKAKRSDDNYLIPRMNTSFGMKNWKLIIKMMIPFIF